jgi:FMN-dependent NADH-azoreductase
MTNRITEGTSLSMNLLHLDSSILGPQSVSRSMSAHVVDQLGQKVPGLRVTYRDLAAAPIPHLSGPYVAVTLGGADVPRDVALSEDLALGEIVMQEFLAADIVVIGVAFYNFSISSQLKAWVDRIAIAGKTFRYTESGQLQGLAGSKHVILAIARGGFYGYASPARSMEHAETYLRSAFSFIGVTKLDVIEADGLKVSAEQRQRAIAQAELRIAQTIAALAPS